jgi:hypothetical protein
MWKQQPAQSAIVTCAASATSQQNCIPRTTRFETPGTGDIHRRVEWGMECNYEYRDRNDRLWSILRCSLGIFPEGCQGNQSCGRNSSQERYEYPARVPNTSIRHSTTGLLFISFLTSTIKGLVNLLEFLPRILEVLIRYSVYRPVIIYESFRWFATTFKVALGIAPEHGMRLFHVLFQLKCHDHNHNRQFMSQAHEKY